MKKAPDAEYWDSSGACTKRILLASASASSRRYPKLGFNPAFRQASFHRQRSNVMPKPVS